MSPRALTLSQAQARYPHRFTMEHVPSWATKPMPTDTAQPRFYAPQYRSDQEWYELTVFPGEERLGCRVAASDTYACHSMGQTWPLGDWLTQPYQKVAKAPAEPGAAPEPEDAIAIALDMLKAGAPSSAAWYLRKAADLCEKDADRIRAR